MHNSFTPIDDRAESLENGLLKPLKRFLLSDDELSGLETSMLWRQHAVDVKIEAISVLASPQPALDADGALAELIAARYYVSTRPCTLVCGAHVMMIAGLCCLTERSPRSSQPARVS